MILGKTVCCRLFFGSEGRGNRFPSGSNRVPVCKIVTLGIFELRNRVVRGEEPGSTCNFSKENKIFSGNRFPYLEEPGSHTFFQGACFQTSQEPVPAYGGTELYCNFLKN